MMCCGAYNPCKDGSGCYACHPEKLGKPEWELLVRNRQLDDLEDLLLRAKHHYYCEADPIMTDSRYDMLEHVLKLERPKSVVILGVGCLICFETKSFYRMG